MIQYDTLTYTKIEVSNDLLASFEEEGYTYLHCTYITSPRYHSGWWVNISEDSFLTNGKEEIKMLQAMNIPLSPKKHYLKKFGDSLQFVLIFPAVPKSWNTFNFIERTQPTLSKERSFDAELGVVIETIQKSEGLYINNIERNNTGVYKVIIQ
jgi:hypothetical protein